jgi:hypothetical protein
MRAACWRRKREQRDEVEEEQQDEVEDEVEEEEEEQQEECSCSTAATRRTAGNNVWGRMNGGQGAGGSGGLSRSVDLRWRMSEEPALLWVIAIVR